MATISSVIKKSICYLIRFYRYFISPILPASCRFYPSCSVYALESVQRYGFWSGGWKALKRIARCHPWADGGYDPVTPNEEKN